jgi:hypothetical protein
MKFSRPSTREHVPPKQKRFTQQMSYALGCGDGRVKNGSKDLKSVGGVPNYTAFAAYFSPL